MRAPLLDNATARRLLLAGSGLAAAPRRAQGPDELLELIREIGFVQVDSVLTVERAHHMILFARNQTYRREALRRLLEDDGRLFENWTHDASILPSGLSPYSRHHFRRTGGGISERWHGYGRTGFTGHIEAVKDRIAQEGPLMARDFGTPGKKASGGWWNWHEEKTALEFLWRTGGLAIAGRQGFQKIYDLPERVIPAADLDARVGEEDFVDWACKQALHRLHFATAAEIAGFWGLLSTGEAEAWCRRERGRQLIQVGVEPADGSSPRPAHMLASAWETAREVPAPPARLRVLSPFDPLIRDRARLARVFGFDYRIEIFVPKAKRQYGYYVFPLLESTRLVGRIDMTHDRKGSGALRVTGLWWEPGVRASRGRLAALAAELERIARFVGAGRVEMASLNPRGASPRDQRQALE